VPLARTTQAMRLAAIASLFNFLERRDFIQHNPAREIKRPRIPTAPTRKDYLDLQEATALLQCQAQRVATHKEGSYLSALHHRDLTLLCLALATGRRCLGLVSLKHDQLDLKRRELRVNYEKGRAGRVLPVIGWAINVCAEYMQKARPRLLKGRVDAGWLFPGNRHEHVARGTFANMLGRLHARAADENPDLEAFAEKHLSPHCLRVSFATLLFKGGCDIRSVNELMLHRNLSTTARYTPIPLEDLRRVVRVAHPRA